MGSGAAGLASPPGIAMRTGPVLHPAGPVAQWLEPAAHNGLVAGSSPAGPTTHSAELANTETACESPRNGGFLGGSISLDRLQGSPAPNLGRLSPARKILFLARPGGQRAGQGRRIEEARQLGLSLAQEAKPSIASCRDHSSGASRRLATPTPRGRRPSIAALTRVGAKNASEIVMFTCRIEQPSLAAI